MKLRTPTVTALAVLALAISGKSQVNVSAVVQSDLQASSSSLPGLNPPPIPAGTSLTGTTTLTASGASIVATELPGTGFRIAANTATVFPFDQNTATGTVRVSFSAPQPVIGSFQVSVTGSLAEIDLGSDRSLELQNPLEFLTINPPNMRSAPFVLDSTPVTVDLRSTLSIFAQSFPALPPFSNMAEVRFIPGPLDPPTGMGCMASLSGIVRAGTSSAFELSLTGSVSGAVTPANSTGFFVFGLNPMSIPLPGGACQLALDPIIAIPATLVPLGPISFTTVDVPIVDLSILVGLRVQFLSLDTTSGSLTVGSSTQFVL